jgi:hypothetical protein
MSLRSLRNTLLAAATAGGLALAVQPAVGQAPPGFSPLDKSNPATSKQDSNLKPHPTPPVAAAADKLPLDKIKLPAGFKGRALLQRPSRRAHHGDG